MKDKYLVFSGNWSEEVEASCFADAATLGMKIAFDKYGESFIISKRVVAVNVKKDVWSFDSIAIMEDLGLYFLAAQIKTFLNNHENTSRS